MSRRVLLTAVVVGGLVISNLSGAGPVHGIRVDPPRQIQPVSLIDQESQTRRFPLEQPVWQLVIFGYTHCPDVCPMTLHKTSQLLKDVSEARTRLRIVFVSIDGSRDTAPAMKDFVGKFDSQIIGLTGEPESLQAAANAFDVLTRRFQGKTAMAYTLVHSSLLYVLDPEGRLRAIYPGNVAIEDIASDLRIFWNSQGRQVSGLLPVPH